MQRKTAEGTAGFKISSLLFIFAAGVTCGFFRFVVGRGKRGGETKTFLRNRHMGGHGGGGVSIDTPTPMHPLRPKNSKKKKREEIKIFFAKK